MACRIPSYSRVQRWFTPLRRGELLRIALAAVILLFVSGYGNSVLAEPESQISAEEVEEEETDEILLPRRELRSLRRKPTTVCQFVEAVSKRGELAREMAILPRTGHVLAGGLRAPLRC